MNLPGHRYLGPGNPIPNGLPIDADDRIALLHDLRYSEAASHTDIRRSDREAIKLFSTDFVYNRNWHSLIGAVGVLLKYVAETVTGVLYPRTFIGSGSFRRSVKRKFAEISGCDPDDLGASDDEEDDSRARLKRPRVT